MFVVIALQIASLFLLLGIRLWNQRLSKRVRQSLPLQMHQRVLSMKFQVEETLRVTSIFLPIAAAKCSLTAFAALAVYLRGLVSTMKGWNVRGSTFNFPSFLICKKRFLGSWVLECMSSSPVLSEFELPWSASSLVASLLWSANFDSTEPALTRLDTGVC